MDDTDFAHTRRRWATDREMTAAAEQRLADEEGRKAAERERWAGCGHESSHAVVSILLSRPFSAVYAPPAGRMIGGEPATTAAEVNADAAVSCAGAVGELLYFTDMEALGENPDWRAITRGLMSDGDRRAVEISVEQFNAAGYDTAGWQDPIDLASSVLARPGAADAVRRVAGLLADRGTLTEAEVRRAALDAVRAAGD